MIRCILPLIPDIDDTIFEVCWNPSPGMYAFIAEKYKEVKLLVGNATDLLDMSHSGSVFVKTIEVVQQEIMARVSMDYTLFLRLSDDQDPRAHLWNVMYDLIFDGLDAYKQLAMRRIDMLAIFSTKDGKLFLSDDYLRWFISTHNNSHVFEAIPIISLSPFFQALFEKHQSSFQLLNPLQEKIRELFEKETLAAYEVDQQDYHQFFRQSCKWYLNNDVQALDWSVFKPVHRLAAWITFMAKTPFGLMRNIEGRVTSFTDWALNNTEVKAYNERPMWELAMMLRNFCAHAIEEPTTHTFEKSMVVNFVNKLWGTKCKKILLDVVLLNVRIFKECK